MNRALSLYLDLMRFSAAMVVFFDHAAQGRWSGSLLWQFSGFGLDAVMVFFVLSGFVISYAAKEREKSAKKYAINRMARIYSVTIPALVLTFILDPIGISKDPSLYLTWTDYVPKQMVWQTVNALLFTNQAWFNRVQPGTIGPYWSMGYEIPYYVIFGIITFAPRRWAAFGAALIILAVGPNIAIFLPIWLFGVAGYNLCQKNFLQERTAFLLWIGTIVAAAILIFYEPAKLAPPYSPQLFVEGIKSLAHYYALSILFAVNIVSFAWCSSKFSIILDFFSEPIRWMGNRTFSLYLFHMPITQFIVAVIPTPPSSWQTRVLVFLGVPVVTMLLAEVTERRKEFWRRGFSALFDLARVRFKVV